MTTMLWLTDANLKKVLSLSRRICCVVLAFRISLCVLLFVFSSPAEGLFRHGLRSDFKTRRYRVKCDDSLDIFGQTSMMVSDL